MGNKRNKTKRTRDGKAKSKKSQIDESASVGERVKARKKEEASLRADDIELQDIEPIKSKRRCRERVRRISLEVSAIPYTKVSSCCFKRILESANSINQSNRISIIGIEGILSILYSYYNAFNR